MDETMFSGIPSLDDDAGLEQFMNNQALADMGISDHTPAALQQTAPTNTAPAAPQAPAASPEPTPSNAGGLTAEQLQQIVARNQQLETALAQELARRQQAAAQPQAQPVYTPQQIAVIKQLLDRGVPLSAIQNALNGNSQQNAQQTALMQRLQGIEQYLQQQQYAAEQTAFVDKMTAFGNKFGLSEDDLVTFGNKALTMGINLTQVNDVESVFRAVYPEQYAIRVQRMSNAPTSHIYGGANVPDAPRAVANKAEDAYVESFLKHSMPNQYGMRKQ